MAAPSRRGFERQRQPLRAFAVVLQKMQRHALRRLGSDAGKTAQRLGQLLEAAERFHWCAVYLRDSTLERKLESGRQRHTRDRKSTRLNSSHVKISYA